MTDAEQDYRIALAGTLPDDQHNGWVDIAADLDDDRETVRYARVAFNVQKVTEVTATGRRIVVVQLLRIEPTENDNEARELADLFEQRTGQATLFREGDDDE